MKLATGMFIALLMQKIHIFISQFSNICIKVCAHIVQITMNPTDSSDPIRFL